MKIIEKNTFISSITQACQLLSAKEKRKLNSLILFSFIAGTIDIISVFSVLPFVSVLIEPNLIKTNKYLNSAWLFLNSPKTELFLLEIGIFAALIVILASLTTIYSQVEANRFSAKAQERLGNSLIRMMYYTSYEWHLKYNPLVLTTIFSEHAAVWNRDIIRQIPLLFGKLPSILLPFLGLFIISPKIAIIIILTLSPLMLVLFSKIKFKTSELFKKKQNAFQEISIFCSETLQGIKDVQLSSNQEIFLREFSKIYHSLCMTVSSSTNWKFIPSSLTLTVGQIFIIFIGVILFLGNVRSGELASIMAIVILIAAKIVPSINKIAVSFIGITSVKSWINTLHEINIDLKNNYLSHKELVSESNKIKWNELELRNIFFSYQENKKVTLNNINLKIEKGKHYGFAGQSGSGKSTTIDICLGLIKANSGKLLLNNSPLNKKKLKKWQSLISYVPQNPLISDASLRENVAFGINSNLIDDEQVINCLKMANIFDLNNSLPNGIYTRLGNGGRRLSGGQKQRLAIARALYKRPQILVLDEATSSMDLINEEIITQIIANLQNDTTVISISHRLSTMRNSDLIYLFDKGNIVDQGSYDYLLRNSKLFNKLALNDVWE